MGYNRQLAGTREPPDAARWGMVPVGTLPVGMRQAGTPLGTALVAGDIHTEVRVVGSSKHLAGEDILPPDDPAEELVGMSKAEDESLQLEAPHRSHLCSRTRVVEGVVDELLKCIVLGLEYCWEYLSIP